MQLPLEAGGMRLSGVHDSLGAVNAHVAAGEGDILFESEHMVASIGGRVDSYEGRLRRGSVLDVALKDLSLDRLKQLRTVLNVDGIRVPLELLDIKPVVAGGRLALVIDERGGSLRLTTRIELDSKRPELHLETTVHNEDSRSRTQIRIGDLVEWPGTPTYAPRLGFVTEEQIAEVPWIAKEGTSLSYALVFRDGPQEVHFRFDRVGSSDNLTLSKGFRLAAGAKRQYRRTLIVTDRRLPKVSEAAFRLLGKPLGRVQGAVSPPPTWAMIEARYPDGKPVTQTELSDQGEFDLWLPEGEYTIALRAPGGSDEQEVSVSKKAPALVQLLAPMAGSLRFAIRDTRKRLMPGRLSIRGVHPTKNPDFGTQQRAQGIRNVVYSGTGQGVVQLPPGRYRVLITRGFEYDIFEQEIAVDESTGASVRATLKRQLDTLGWVSGDFHLHAAPSFDSSVPLHDRVVSLAAEGVEFAVATDHNHVTDYGPAVHRADLSDTLSVSPGIEVTTQNWGHFIAFPYPPDQPPPPYEGVAPSLIFDAIRESAPGAVIQVNHPRMEYIAYFAKLDVHPNLAKALPPPPAEGSPPEDEPFPAESESDGTDFVPPLLSTPDGFSFDFDTLEVVNGFELEKPEVMQQNLIDWFALLNLGHRHTGVGNSDSHALIHQWAGYPRTYVKVESDDPAALTPNEVASALLYGRAQISNAIFLDVRANKNAGPGSEISIDNHQLTLRVLARAAPWVDVTRAEVWVNGVARASTTKVAGRWAKNRIQWSPRLELPVDAWLVVIARGERPLSERFPGGRGKPFAIMNPIFVDVDGDGVFRAPLASPPEQPPELEVSAALSAAQERYVHEPH